MDKFAVQPENIAKVPYFHLIADIEDILDTNKDRSIRDSTRASVVNIIQNHVYRKRNGDTTNLKDRFVLNALKSTNRFLKQHAELCILQSDKGNRTVVMLRTEYDKRMRGLLDDVSTYERIPRDPTISVQGTNNDLILTLFTEGHIDKRTAEGLTSKSVVCPRIYGMPKAHKDGLPLRTVVPI